MKLYEISEEYRDASRTLLDADTELSDAAIADTLESLRGELADKLLAVCKMVDTLRAEGKAVLEVCERLSNRADRVVTRSDRLKAYALYHMQVCDIREVKDSEILVRRVLNPPHVRISDPTLIPDHLMRVIPEWREPARGKIAQALKSGEEVPGCTLVQDERLRIT